MSVALRRHKPKRVVPAREPGLMLVKEYDRLRRRIMWHELQAVLSVLAVSIDTYYRVEFFELHSPLHEALGWLFQW